MLAEQANADPDSLAVTTCKQPVPADLKARQGNDLLCIAPEVMALLMIA